MNTNEFQALGSPALVYVREVAGREIIAEIGDAAPSEIEPDAVLYAVHAADGERLAVVDDRELAFTVARQRELQPVSVH